MSPRQSLQPAHEPATAVVVRLDAADIEAIAEQVAAKLRNDGVGRFGDVHAVCARFGVSVDFVYAHANELGAIRLGRGPKARLRFDLAEAERRLLHGSRPPGPVGKPAHRRVRKQRAGAVEADYVRALGRPTTP